MTPAKGYTEMKDSRADWIGKIPATWDVSKIGTLYTQRNEKVSDKDYPPLSVTMKGILPQLATAAKTDDGDNRKLVRVGDFAINSRSDRRGSCGISPYDGSVSLINTILVPRKKMHPGYYDWLFHTTLFADEFYKWGHGIVDDLWTTRWQEMKRILVPVPPYETQSAIAAYLDTQCAKIDEIIAQAKASIEDLEAYELSVISKKVDSQKWTKMSLRHCIQSIEQGWSPPPAEDVDTENGWSVLALSAVKHGAFNHDARKPIDSNAKIPENLELHKGDFLMTRSNTRELVGDVCVVDTDIKHTIFSDLIYRISFNEKLLPQYAKYLLRSPYVRFQIQRAAQGSSGTMPKISHKVIKALNVYVPDGDEQDEINGYLDSVSVKIRSLVAEKQSLIDDLESYKKSLIYEAVTGKRRV